MDDHDGAGVPAPSYLTLLRDGALRPVLLLTFLSAFVGYAQMEAGFTAFARLVGRCHRARSAPPSRSTPP